MNPLEINRGYHGNFVEGIVPGIVSNNKDPDKLGRVKIILPVLGTDHEQQSSNGKGIETDWAPVLSFAAGNNRGGYFIPEVNDEVLVSFLLGDINRPFVVGVSWNNEDKPPQKNDNGKNDIKQITTRSGNTILFDDEEGNSKIQIFDKDRKDEISISAKENSISIKSDKVINLTSTNGEVTIKAKKITIEAKDRLNMKASSISMKSTGSLSLEGSSVTVKSSGVVSVKGSMVNLN